MTRPLACIGLLALALWGCPPRSSTSSGSCPSRVLGAWEYRQAAGDGYDREGERLELTCKDDSLRGLYFGLERAGEHGLFYTLVEVRNLTATPSGRISFVVPERELFQRRPQGLQAVHARILPSSGVTRDELRYQGYVDNGRLVFNCVSKDSSCPEKRMVFNPSEWGDPEQSEP
jgi:hypothetical protein